MRLRSSPYFLRQAVTNIVTNRMVHVVGVGTMVVSLLILGSCLLLFLNINQWLQGWGQDLTMSVYLKEGLSEVQIKEISSQIKELPSAEIERVISKEQAMEEFRRALGPQAILLDGLRTNPLPASIEVVFRDEKEDKIDPIPMKETLESIPGVEEVQYSEEWIERFEGVMKMVEAAGFVVGGLLCLGVLFIVTNTIKLTIYSRREEIEILKLVGATDWFIKTPFLIEGIFQGASAALFSLLLLFLGFLFLSAGKIPLLGLAVLEFSFLPLGYMLAICILGVVLGLIGSFIAIGRFFRL
jgi:cell division transport system permease protein